MESKQLPFKPTIKYFSLHLELGMFNLNLLLLRLEDTKNQLWLLRILNLRNVVSRNWY